MAHPLFGPELREMLATHDTPGLDAFCETLHPATIAEVLEGEFNAEQIWQIIGTSEIRTQAGIFEYLPLDMQVEMAEGPHRPQVAQLLGKMSHDDRVDLLRRLPQAVNESILRLVDEADRRDIKTLFEYGENTVGAIMTTDYAWLPPNLTANEAVEQLRQQAPDRETIYYIYIQEETKKVMGYERASIVPRKLLGFISLRELILAPKNALVRDLMDEELITLKYTDDRELAAQIMARYDFLAVPVLDDQGAMLGIVTHDDALDVVTQEATEDMQRQAGMTPLSESYLTVRFSKLWRNRAQWLAVLFIAELGTFTVLEFFEGMIASVVVLTLFIPLCISTGGNTGSQASTLVTRAIALGEVKLSDWKRLIRREMLMGLALGLSLGLIAFVRGATTPDDTRAGPREQKYDLQAVFPADAKIERDERGDYIVPKSTAMIVEADKEYRLRLPEQVHEPAVRHEGGNAIYTFQAGSHMRTEPVDRWKLGWVIGLAVLFICMWGTIIGASLPLVFKRIGWDPAVASGPFVATFVDISGIAIFCSLAKWLLM